MKSLKTTEIFKMKISVVHLFFLYITSNKRPSSYILRQDYKPDP